jgi:hypothetical protein
MTPLRPRVEPVTLAPEASKPGSSGRTPAATAASSPASAAARRPSKALLLEKAYRPAVVGSSGIDHNSNPWAASSAVK